MRVGSLCTGGGGLDLAVKAIWPDAELAWVSETDKHAAALLERRFPGVPNLGDLTQVDWKEMNHMAGHRNDALAQEMYDLYCQGLSLAQVGAEYGMTRQSVYDKFKRRGWGLRSRPPARPTVEFNGRKFSLRNNGYYGATDGEREMLHRVVWEHHNGPIPPGYDIHHRDHDKTNNDIGNLECLPKDEHARLYGLGCNGFAHKCGKEVMPGESPAVDIVAAGFP